MHIRFYQKITSMGIVTSSKSVTVVFHTCQRQSWYTNTSHIIQFRNFIALNHKIIDNKKCFLKANLENYSNKKLFLYLLFFTRGKNTKLTVDDFAIYFHLKLLRRKIARSWSSGKVKQNANKNLFFCFLSGKITNCRQLWDLLSLDYFSEKNWKIGLAKENATENTFKLGIELFGRHNTYSILVQFFVEKTSLFWFCR